MGKIVTKQINLNFDRRKTLWKSTIAFNFRIVDGHIEFKYNRSCKNYHILFNVGTSNLETRNIRLVNTNHSPLLPFGDAAVP
jgi:hypothetical protein